MSLHGCLAFRPKTAECFLSSGDTSTNSCSKVRVNETLVQPVGSYSLNQGVKPDGCLGQGGRLPDTCQALGNLKSPGAGRPQDVLGSSHLGNVVSPLGHHPSNGAYLAGALNLSQAGLPQLGRPERAQGAFTSHVQGSRVVIPQGLGTVRVASRVCSDVNSPGTVWHGSPQEPDVPSTSLAKSTNS